MTAELARIHLVSPEDYLREEERAERKHEFLNGLVYAMAGATRTHNRIATNILTALGNGLRGGPCEAFGSDMKVRVRHEGDTRFYYPDAQVECEGGAADAVFTDNPVLIIEVISKSTRRIDESEKKDGYLLIPALQLYLLVEPARPLVVGYRRTPAGFVHEAHS